jgi:hypothetical protein
MPQSAPGPNTGAWSLWTGRQTGHTIVGQAGSVLMRFTDFSFGSMRVDGVTYDHDLVLDRRKIRRRTKSASKKFRDTYGHLQYRSPRTFPGGADGWSSVPVRTARCR